MAEKKRGCHRVLMWAPPRSLSTCVERAFIEHPEIHVQHEPWGAPFYWSEEAQSTREAKDQRPVPSYGGVARDVLLDPPRQESATSSRRTSATISLRTALRSWPSGRRKRLQMATR